MERFVCFFTDTATESSRDQVFDSLAEAQKAAVDYCGCSSYNKPFPHEDTYLYGPGDGTTSVIVRKYRGQTNEQDTCRA